MNRLRELREDRDLTQKDVGSALGISNTAISNYETGFREMSLELLCTFASYYGVTTDYILCLSNQPRPAVSESDTALLTAYHAAPLEIRRIVDTALAPYAPEEKTESSAS